MRNIAIALAISSVLLGAAATATEPSADPAQPTQVTPQTDPSRPTADSAQQEATSSAERGSSQDVGSSRSNVDEKSSSGSYYPYSAGTVGDDPSEPKTTTLPQGTNLEASDTSEPTDQWKGADADGDGFLTLAELTKAAPALSDKFSEMDVDGDDKLTRGEFRSWHESHKARMDADEAPSTPSSEAQRPATE